MTQSRHYRAPFGPGGDLPVDEALCGRLLGVALQNGGDYADVFFEYRASGAFSFDEGALKATSRGVTLGVGVRVLRGGATGYACTEDLSWDAMKRAAQVASHIAAGGGGRETIALARRPLPRRYEVDVFTLDIPLREKRALCERAASAALSTGPQVTAAEVSFAEEVREILVATSDGAFAYDVQPLFRISVRATAHQHGRRAQGVSGGGGRMGMSYFDDKSPEWHGHQAAGRALLGLDAREAPRGVTTVVFAPGDSGILLVQTVGRGLEGDFVAAGSSVYAPLLGRSVTPHPCTLVDDAGLPGARGSINVDDEGVVPGQTALIEGGRLRGYLHDRRSARLLGAALTGNGRRESFYATPQPSMTNIVMLAGPHEPEAIFRSVKRGILASAFGGGQVDMYNGDFVFSLTESYLIEDGKITAILRESNVLGNGLEMLRNITMLGNDVAVSDGIWTLGKNGQSLPASVACPTMKIEGLTIG